MIFEVFFLNLYFIQSSLPEQRNPPEVVPPAAPLPHRRLRPPTPCKPSTLALGPRPGHTLQPPGYQMPVLSISPSTNTTHTGHNGHNMGNGHIIGNGHTMGNGLTRTQDTMVHFNGGSGGQHRTLPPLMPDTW